VATPLQHAAAVALATDDGYYERLRRDYRARRDRLCAGLARVGFAVAPPQGTYFAVADVRPVGFEDDVAFCRVLPERAGVAAIPLSAFGTEGGPRTTRPSTRAFAACSASARSWTAGSDASVTADLTGLGPSGTMAPPSGRARLGSG
jgi:aspartate/methionine/tyrosine aminotransferase